MESRSTIVIGTDSGTYYTGHAHDSWTDDPAEAHGYATPEEAWKAAKTLETREAAYLEGSRLELCVRDPAEPGLARRAVALGSENNLARQWQESFGEPLPAELFAPGAQPPAVPVRPAVAAPSAPTSDQIPPVATASQPPDQQVVTLPLTLEQPKDLNQYLAAVDWGAIRARAGSPPQNREALGFDPAVWTAIDQQLKTRTASMHLAWAKHAPADFPALSSEQLRAAPPAIEVAPTAQAPIAEGRIVIGDGRGNYFEGASDIGIYDYYAGHLDAKSPWVADRAYSKEYATTEAAMEVLARIERLAANETRSTTTPPGELNLYVVDKDNRVVPLPLDFGHFPVGQRRGA